MESILGDDLQGQDRRSWMFYSVTKRTKTGPESHRGRSFIYRLEDHKGEPRQVCKVFFLSSLGYHPKNDSLVIGSTQRPERKAGCSQQTGCQDP